MKNEKNGTQKKRNGENMLVTRKCVQTEWNLHKRQYNTWIYNEPKSSKKAFYNIKKWCLVRGN